jgi:hypothetical protein
MTLRSRHLSTASIVLLLISELALGEEVAPIDLPPMVTLVNVDAVTTQSGRRIGEIRIPISVSSDSCPSGTKSLRFQIRGTSGEVRIADVLPSTTQVDIAAGPIHIVLTEKKAMGAFDLQLAYDFTPKKGQVKANGKVDKRSATSAITANLLPPKATVIAAGTLDRGKGAFFRFEQTSRHELAKRHHISLLVDVAKSHSVEAFVVDVQARGNEGEVVERSMLLICRCDIAEVDGSEVDKIITLYKKSDRLRRRMNNLFDRADELRNHVAFPQLGFGTKRATTLKEAGKLQRESKDTLSQIRSKRDVVPATEFVWHRVRLWQAKHRYSALSKQADKIRDTVGFPNFGLGSALARTQADADDAKRNLDKCEAALLKLDM